MIKYVYNRIGVYTLAKQPKWSAAEISELENLYSTGSREQLEAALPCRDWAAIRQRGAKLKIGRQNLGRLWEQYHHDYNLTEIEAAYLAGIVDGEGHISLIRAMKRPGKATYVLLSPMVGITNQSEPLIQWMDQRIVFSKQLYHPDTSGWGWAYKLTIQGLRVYPLLKALLPYLIVKRKRAELLMEFCEIRAVAGSAQSYGPREWKIAEEIKTYNGHREIPSGAVLSLSGRSLLPPSTTSPPKLITSLPTAS
jgi:hypothetical protein